MDFPLFWLIWYLTGVLILAIVFIVEKVTIEPELVVLAMFVPMLFGPLTIPVGIFVIWLYKKVSER